MRAFLLHLVLTAVALLVGTLLEPALRANSAVLVAFPVGEAHTTNVSETVGIHVVFRQGAFATGAFAALPGYSMS